MDIFDIHKLQSLEEQADTWLTSRSKAVDGHQLFVALMSTPYITEGAMKQRDYVASCEEILAATFASTSESSNPLVLSVDEAQCACADLKGLSVGKIHLSGSARERVDVRIFHDMNSDLDVMFQMEPVTVLGSSNAIPERTNSGIVLIPERTSNPGYVLLKHPPSSSCSHSGQLTFAGDRVVKLLDKFRGVLNEAEAPGAVGPALNTTVSDVIQVAKSIDLVACVQAEEWPFEDFLTRPRLSGWPSESLVNALCTLPVFLVPVGFPGSATMAEEWRVSFSRQEYAVMRHMSQTQRSCLTILKSCKAVLGGLHALKSFYLKTSLMWLCESLDKSIWSPDGIQESLMTILTYLEECVQRRALPCYFSPEINVFATKRDEQLAELVVDIQTLKSHILSSSLALVANWVGADISRVGTLFLPDESGACETATDIERLLLTIGREDLFSGRLNLMNMLKHMVTYGGDWPRLILPFAFNSPMPLLCQPLMASLRSVLYDGCSQGRVMSLIISALQTLLKVENRGTSLTQDAWMLR